MIVLADRVHAGVPFLDCIESLGWMDVFRLSCATHVKTAKGWQTVGRMHPRRYPTRRLEQVQRWKRQPWTTNLVIHRHEPLGQRAVVWYLATNLPPTEACCLLYGIRWWQERGVLCLKSAGFGWERSRMTILRRIEVLLVGVACATWLVWMLGRLRDRRPKIRATTIPPQPRRSTILRLGTQRCRDVCTGRVRHVPLILPAFRTLAYERTFIPECPFKGDVMQ